MSRTVGMGVSTLLCGITNVTGINAGTSKLSELSSSFCSSSSLSLSSVSNSISSGINSSSSGINSCSSSTSSLISSSESSGMPIGIPIGIKDFDENSNKFTLELIIELDFQSYSEDIQDISNAATMELQIENNIKNIASIWRKQSIEMAFYRDGIYRIKSVDECTQLLEEHMVQISAMKATRFVEPFITVVDS
uniref:Dynein heavy chain linker domain-containing protein n=1 Tax=Glossina palpalis gambiensis TaxID=67801 RepID=A0A1B0BE78_9MUSC